MYCFHAQGQRKGHRKGHENENTYPILTLG